MEEPMKTRTKMGVALAALLAVPALAFAHPGFGKGDPARRAERHAAMLERFDANGDGQLDDAERQVAHETRAKERFAQLDTNKDGFLSFEEFKAGRNMRGPRGGGPPAAPPAQK
jgi:hypothetical protein